MIHSIENIPLEFEMAVRRAALASCAGAEEVVRMIGGKWKLLILRQLIYERMRRASHRRCSQSNSERWNVTAL